MKYFKVNNVINRVFPLETLLCFYQRKSIQAPTTLGTGNLNDQKVFQSRFYVVINISVIFIYLFKKDLLKWNYT